MPRANLRQLSRQLARGAISKADYRRQRAALIAAMLDLLGRDGEPTGRADDDTGNDADTAVPARNNGRG